MQAVADGTGGAGYRPEAGGEREPMKKLKWIVLGAVMVVAVAVVAVVLNIDRAARKGVEIGGTQALGVETTCGGVHVGLLSGSVGLKDLRIANPEGYKTDRIVSLGSGKVTCDIGSLMGDEVVVHEILIDAPEMTLELKPALPPKTNIGDLLKKLESDKQQPEEEGEPKTFEVELIRITGAKVRFHLIGGKTADLTLPDIELKDIKNADGTPPMLGDIFAQVLASMGTAAVHKAKLEGAVPAELLAGFGGTLASAQNLLGDGAGQLKAQAAALQGELGKLTGELEKRLGGLGKGLGEEAGKITGGIKGILGGNKDDEKKPGTAAKPDDESSSKKGLGGKLKGLLD